MANRIHRIMIEQQTLNSENNMVDNDFSLGLLELSPGEGQTTPGRASGKWKQLDVISKSWIPSILGGASDSRDMDWYWQNGNLVIGLRSTSASSHRDSDNFQLFIKLTLNGVSRSAMKRFGVRGPLTRGIGVLRNNVAGFKAGYVFWSVFDYDAWADPKISNW